MNNQTQAVYVRFFDQIHPTPFLVGELDIKYGQKVVALSNRGLAIGIVNSSPFNLSSAEQGQGVQSILKIATDQDTEACKKLYQQQRQVAPVFQQLVRQLGLKLKLKHFEYVSGGEKIIFYYSSSVVIDLTELQGRLRQKLSVEIELQSLSKQNTESVGPCGMELCLFIRSTQQGASLAGRCGESKCCLDDKDPFYEDKLSRLPRVGDFIQTQTEEVGRVEKVDLVREEFELLTEGAVVRRYVAQMFRRKLGAKPAGLDLYPATISRETNLVIGRQELDARQALLQARQAEEMGLRAKQFVEKEFALLFNS
jgi:cell fate regulator YaaT (PSP1 superfamily)